MVDFLIRIKLGVDEKGRVKHWASNPDIQIIYHRSDSILNQKIKCAIKKMCYKETAYAQSEMM